MFLYTMMHDDGAAPCHQDGLTTPEPEPEPEHEVAMFVYNSARAAMEHYGLGENDIFTTPDQCYKIVDEHLQVSMQDAKEIFDPCPAPRDDGTFAPDGRKMPWAKTDLLQPAVLAVD